MITGCPTDNVRFNNDCTLALSKQLLTWFHFIPVEVNKIVYPNVYCAWCHGVSTVQDSFWGTLLEDNPCLRKNKK